MIQKLLTVELRNEEGCCTCHFSATRVVSAGRGLGTFVRSRDMSGVRAYGKGQYSHHLRIYSIQPDPDIDDSEEYCRYLGI